MNKRIKELVAQAESHAYEHEEHWHDGPDWQELFNEKFAELIVKECAGVELYWLSEQDRKAVAEKIKQHFGVE